MNGLRTMSGEDLRLQLKGLLMIVTLCALIALSIGIYAKVFSDEIRVTVRAERAGLQLGHNGDVRMRGVLVGRVADLDVSGDHAEITLALDRDKARDIPANVHARIVPTTLFGQKYVDLVTMDAPASTSVQDGAVIGVDRSSTAVELNRVLDDLEPVLTAVRPQQLSMTLEAVAHGLSGRGEHLGENAVRARAYLGKFRAHVPLLMRNLRAFARLSNNYAEVMPDLLRLLSHSTVTARTVLDETEAAREFYTELTQLSVVAKQFFRTNGDGLVEVNRRGRPVLDLLAEYSPEYTCVLEALVVGEANASKTFHDHKFWASNSFSQQMDGYTESDRPEMGDAGVGPSCLKLPHPVQPLDIPTGTKDGADWPSAPLLPGGVALP